MRPLGLTLVLASGRARIALVVATTAVACALLLVAVSILRLWELDRGSGPVVAWRPGGTLGAIADPGTRAGAVAGVLLMTLPLLLLLDQAVRLGSTSRRRRYAALSVAGADSRDLRRWGALEVGLPALLGALLGVPLWLLLRLVLGQGLEQHGAGLVPTSIGPGGWTWLVVALVAAYGALVGRRAGARTARGTARGAERDRDAGLPRPWGLVVLLGAVVALSRDWFGDSDLGSVALVAALVVGLASLGPWLAAVSAGAAARRARSPALLLAARRLDADPRPAGRAAASVGAVGLALGAATVFLVDVLGGLTQDVAYYVVPAAVAIGCALAALGVIAVSLAVHSTETVLERRREMATLVATGVPARVVSASQRLECLVATVPLAVVGAAIGAFGYAWMISALAETAPWAGGAVLASGALSAGACWAVTAVLRPWVADALDPENLRTA